MMKAVLLGLLLPVAFQAPLSAGEGVFADDFKSYRDFDPGLRNWAFRGVGGSVLDGSYQFTGVTQKSSEYWDVNPDFTMGFVRDFPAGRKLKIEARFSVGPYKYDAFDPGKGTASKIGLAVLDQPLIRRKRVDMNAPLLTLTLDKGADGKRYASFDYSGDPKLKLSSKTSIPLAAPWRENVAYDFELVLRDGVATGTIKEGSKAIFSAELRGPELDSVFATAHPGFADLRMTGKLFSFKADNLGSSAASGKIEPLEIPSDWTLFGSLSNPAKLEPLKEIPASLQNAKGAKLKIENGKSLDLGALLGGHKAGKAALLACEVDVKRAGLYALDCSADWFWRLDVNGKTVVDMLKSGNGSKSAKHTVIIPLKQGRNLVDIVVGSGSAGWALALGKSPEAKIDEVVARRHLYGSAALLWNLDRLLDDTAKLKRDEIEIAGLEKRLVELRKSLPPDLSSRETAKYDAFLDEAYAKVYDAYRVLSLKYAIDERKGLARFLVSHENDGRVAELEKLLDPLKAAAGKGDAKAAERISAQAQKIIDECRKSEDGFAEGVSRGGNFGRFGWITGSNIGTYTSGDGLLVNQFLADGALLRQYQTPAAKEESPWLLRFRFDGAKDPAKVKEIASLKTIGESGEIQFGYDPTQFYSGSTPKEVKVKDVNWSHKKFSFADAFVADMSLLSTSTLLESPGSEFILSDPSSGAFSRLGYLDAKGKAVSLDASADGVLYDKARDGALGSNWVLLWSDRNDVKDLTGHLGGIPVEIVFQRQPARIERKGSSIEVSLGKNGALWLSTPFGARIQPVGNWFGELPPLAVATCQMTGRAALAYPQNCREFYKLSADGRRVEIADFFEFRLFKDNDWRIEPLELAPLPPLLSLMAERGFDAVLPEGVVDLAYPSSYGPLRAVKGSTLRYSLPVPQAPFVLLPENLEADAKDAATLRQRAMNAVEGSLFRLYDEKTSRSWHSLSFPISVAAKPWPYLPAVYKDYLKGLFAYEMEASSDYRRDRVWRSLVEPYSGRKYFYSFSIKVDDPGDVGVFGDRGYGVGLHLMQLDSAARLAGNYDALRKIWRDEAPLAPAEASRNGGSPLSVDKMLGYVKDVHDWAWMDDGSNDAGDNGPVVDCCQAPFSGHSSLLRMAKAVGDEREIAYASYHLAKGQLPLIGRLAFTDYGRENGLLGVDSVNVGFREFVTPHSYANSPMLVKSQRQEYDGSYDSVLCYAYHDMLEIYFPYARYAWNDLRRYEDLRKLYFPNSDVRKGSEGHFSSRLKYMLFDGSPAKDVRAIMDRMCEGSIFWVRDAIWLETMPLLLSAGSPLVLTDWAPLQAPEFSFSPSKKAAFVKFQGRVPANFVLKAVSSRRPLSVSDAKGAKLEWNYDPESFVLSIDVPQGDGRALKIAFDETDPARFMPLPIPRPRETAPSLRDEFLPVAFERAPKRAPVAGAPERKVLPQARAKTSSGSATTLFSADFSGAQGPDLAYAGVFSFHDWGKSGQKPSGGLTGAYPPDGVPAHCLEIKAAPDNFTGRSSPAMKLDPSSGAGKELVVSGQVLRSKDYKGNKPMIFLWAVDKDGKGKPLFLSLPEAPNGEWKAFEIVQPLSVAPGAERVFMNVTSQKLSGQDSVSGSVFFKELKVELR